MAVEKKAVEKYDTQELYLIEKFFMFSLNSPKVITKTTEGREKARYAGYGAALYFIISSELQTPGSIDYENIFKEIADDNKVIFISLEKFFQLLSLKPMELADNQKLFAIIEKIIEKNLRVFTVDGKSLKSVQDVMLELLKRHGNVIQYNSFVSFFSKDIKIPNIGKGDAYSLYTSILNLVVPQSKSMFNFIPQSLNIFGYGYSESYHQLQNGIIFVLVFNVLNMINERSNLSQEDKKVLEKTADEIMKVFKQFDSVFAVEVLSKMLSYDNVEMSMFKRLKGDQNDESIMRQFSNKEVKRKAMNEKPNYQMKKIAEEKSGISMHMAKSADYVSNFRSALQQTMSQKNEELSTPKHFVYMGAKNLEEFLVFLFLLEQSKNKFNNIICTSNKDDVDREKSFAISTNVRGWLEHKALNSSESIISFIGDENTEIIQSYHFKGFINEMLDDGAEVETNKESANLDHIMKNKHSNEFFYRLINAFHKERAITAQNNQASAYCSIDISEIEKNFVVTEGVLPDYANASTMKNSKSSNKPNDDRLLSTKISVNANEDMAIAMMRSVEMLHRKCHNRKDIGKDIGAVGVFLAVDPKKKRFIIGQVGDCCAIKINIDNKQKKISLSYLATIHHVSDEFEKLRILADGGKIKHGTRSDDGINNARHFLNNTYKSNVIESDITDYPYNHQKDQEVLIGLCSDGIFENIALAEFEAILNFIIFDHELVIESSKAKFADKIYDMLVKVKDIYKCMDNKKAALPYLFAVISKIYDGVDDKSMLVFNLTEAVTAEKDDIYLSAMIDGFGGSEISHFIKNSFVECFKSAIIGQKDNKQEIAAKHEVKGSKEEQEDAVTPQISSSESFPITVNEGSIGPKLGVNQ